MLDAPKALPGEHIKMYSDPEVAKTTKGLSSNGRQERSDSSRPREGAEGAFARGALRQNVRHRSSFALAEFEEESHSIPAPLISAEQLSESSNC